MISESCQLPIIHGLEQRVLISASSPVEWSSYLGGQAYDGVYGVTVDRDGNAVVAGGTASTDLRGAVNPMWYEGEYFADGFIAKLDVNGQLLWSRYLRGSASVNATVTDAEGNIWLTGQAGSSGPLLPKHTNDFPGNPPGVNLDAFVAKYSSSGEPLWATYLGGTRYEGAQSIVLDAQGNALIAGYTDSADFQGASNLYGRGGNDGFVAKVSGAGEVAWVRYIGGSGMDGANDLVIADDGDLVVSGYTASADLDAATNAYHGLSDAFVARLSADGDLLWTSYIGGVGEDCVTQLIVDADGNLVLVGGTQSTSFSGSSDRSDNADMFVAKVTPDADLLWDTRFGGSEYAAPSSIVIGSSGHVFIVGYTWSDDLLEAMNQSLGDDGFIAELDGSGSLLRSFYIGGSGEDRLNALAIDDKDRLLVAGWTSSDDLPSASNGLQGKTDGFVMRLDLDSTSDAAPVPTLSGDVVGSTDSDTIHVAAVTLVDPSTGQSLAAVQVTINGIARDPFMPDGPLTINGLAGNDTITVEVDVIFPVIIHGGSGNDTITGGSGDDLLYGDDSNDVIVGGGGNDTIYGNFGSDTLSGGTGNDQLFAGLGPDLLNGGDGDDTLVGGNGMDQIRGGAGADSLDGKGKADSLYGGAGNDTIASGAGSDYIAGDDGDDTLYANPNQAFRDTLVGGAGRDVYVAAPDDVLQDVEERLLA